MTVHHFGLQAAAVSTASVSFHSSDLGARFWTLITICFTSWEIVPTNATVPAASSQGTENINIIPILGWFSSELVN